MPSIDRSSYMLHSSGRVFLSPVAQKVVRSARLLNAKTRMLDATYVGVLVVQALRSFPFVAEFSATLSKEPFFGDEGDCGYSFRANIDSVSLVDDVDPEVTEDTASDDLENLLGNEDLGAVYDGLSMDPGDVADVSFTVRRSNLEHLLQNSRVSGLAVCKIAFPDAIQRIESAIDLAAGRARRTEASA